jgi:hypothetical protein
MRKSIDYKKLNEVFKKFAGHEVLVDRVLCEERRGLDDPRHCSVWRTIISTDDTTIAELQKAIEDMGLTLRVRLPGHVGDFSARLDRVNVHIDNFTNDGKYRLGTRYQIG